MALKQYNMEVSSRMGRTDDAAVFVRRLTVDAQNERYAEIVVLDEVRERFPLLMRGDVSARVLG